MAENASARLVGLRSALWLVALAIVVALFFTGMLPRRSLVARLRRDSPPGSDRLSASPSTGQSGPDDRPPGRP